MFCRPDNVVFWPSRTSREVRVESAEREIADIASGLSTKPVYEYTPLKAKRSAPIPRKGDKGMRGRGRQTNKEIFAALT